MLHTCHCSAGLLKVYLPPAKPGAKNAFYGFALDKILDEGKIVLLYMPKEKYLGMAGVATGSSEVIAKPHRTTTPDLSPSSAMLMQFIDLQEVTPKPLSQPSAD
jgi:hypothetical protein